MRRVRDLKWEATLRVVGLNRPQAADLHEMGASVRELDEDHTPLPRRHATPTVRFARYRGGALLDPKSELWTGCSPQRELNEHGGRCNHRCVYRHGFRIEAGSFHRERRS